MARSGMHVPTCQSLERGHQRKGCRSGAPCRRGKRGNVRAPACSLDNVLELAHDDGRQVVLQGPRISGGPWRACRPSWRARDENLRRLEGAAAAAMPRGDHLQDFCLRPRALRPAALFVANSVFGGARSFVV